MKTGNHIASQRGALLVTLIVAMVVIAMAGSAMLYFSSTSSYGEFLANRQERAYYVAESGANYALQQFVLNKVANGPFPTATEFTIGNDKFIVKTYDKPNDNTHLIIESTGIVESGWLTTRQLVTRDIVKETATAPGIPPVTTDSSGVPIGFDTNTNQELDVTWTLTPDTSESEAYVNDSGDLVFKTTQASIVLNTAIVDLCDGWVNSGYLSSYFLQVKINNAQTNPALFMHGLSFRVQDAAGKNSYGLSFYKHDDKKYKVAWCANLSWCEYDQFPTYVWNKGKIYAVLWKNINGTYTLLAAAEMNSTYGVTSTDGSELSNWSTLLIRVNERSDGNHLKAYVQRPSIYPLNTIYWNLSSFKLITWTWLDNSVVTQGSTSTEVIDNKYTSEGLCTCPTTGSSTGCTANRPEVGIHAFYDDMGSATQLFDDFSLAVQGTSGGGSQY